MDSVTESINGSEIITTTVKEKDIETQDKDLNTSTNQSSNEEMTIDKEIEKMKIPKNMKLPKGHGNV